MLNPAQITVAQKTADYDQLCAQRELVEGRLIEAAKAKKLLERAEVTLRAAGFVSPADQAAFTLENLNDEIEELDAQFAELDDRAEELAEELACPACGKFTCADRVCAQINRNE